MSIRKHIQLILVRTLITAKSVIILGSWRGSWHKGCLNCLATTPLSAQSCLYCAIFAIEENIRKTIRHFGGLR